MDVVLLASLAGLALLDSTSIGTLVIPVWMLLAPGRPPVRRLVLYLGVLAAFYFVVGVLILSVARAGVVVSEGLIDTPVVRIAQLALGVGLFAWSFRFDSKKRREAGESDRTAAWRNRALRPDRSSGSVATLAVSAGVVELVTMLPYLAAIALIVAGGYTVVSSLPLLAGYCLIMVIPAGIVLAARVAGGARLDGPLQRLDGFLSRHADSAIGWVIGIAGFLLARDAAAALFTG
ncbi:hypothetical protein G4H71_12970 [Rhodococcus triatomae]|uniref:Sap, sulfolipid-1-addressing protein n=1 Tax=Rhodococcus triatomae TaxID=300028 RepID=A0A1G8GX66_9NOCA|nr:GAP family protein [Rhodococcus triatomae]QNG20272.1 hypothetical protein G4H72_17410 [Rhodococcus triatomae]QNG23813.1 hypothetical protein G4H71_12970 [Rhodococcus triatomae]SDH98988.1 Sap, sulfolipid-1-addressing protein [Rhodococcus triatomae]